MEEGALWPGISPGSSQTPWAGAYLENSQDKRKLAPEVFVLESTTPLASLSWFLGFWGLLQWAESSVAKTLSLRSGL